MTINLKDATPIERVAAGAAFLDRQRPDWVQHIDLAELDMLDYCILDQVPVPEGWEGYPHRENYLNWYDAMYVRELGSVLEAFAFGDELDRAWRREVNRRRLLATSTEC